MKKGVLYISRPSLTSPRLQDAVDNAPDLTGVDLNAPLFSGLSINAPTVASSFGTSPSLLKAVLSYILNYEFDISEFVALLDILDEIRIPKITKEDDLSAFEEFRTFRGIELPDDVVGIPNTFDPLTNTGMLVEVKVSSGTLQELVNLKQTAPHIVNTPRNSIIDVFTATDNLNFNRNVPLEDVVGIPNIFDPLTNTGMLVEVKRSSALQEFSFVSEFKPYIVSGSITTVGPEKVLAKSLKDIHTGYDRVDVVGIPNTFDPATGNGMTVSAEVVPNFVENIDALSSVSQIISGPSIGSVLDAFTQSDEVRKKFSTTARDHTVAPPSGEEGEEAEEGEEGEEGEAALDPYLDYIVGAQSEAFWKAIYDREDSALTKVLLSFVGKQKSLIPEKVLAVSVLEDIFPQRNPEELVLGLSIPKKRVSREEADNITVSQLLPSLVKSAQLSKEKVKITENKAPKKIVLEFVIDETFHSIHTQYPGVLAGRPIGSPLTTQWVDLGPEFDKAIVGPSVDEEGEPLNGDGWAGNIQAQYKNERYVIIDHIYQNAGKFRPGTTTEILKDLRSKYSYNTIAKLGLEEGEIDRYDDSVMVSSDSAQIWSEGGLYVGIRFGIGFGFRGYYGPAPLKYKYSVRPNNFSANRQPEWHTQQGLYYNSSYIETVTHQNSGRRINLFFREMTSEDITISNRHGGLFQIARGTTFIDKMLAHSYWGKIFKFVDTVFKVGAGSFHEELLTTKAPLSSAGRGTLIHDKVAATFLHRYESEALASEDIVYDVLLKYSPGADRDKATVDAFRQWPTDPSYGAQPPDFKPKVQFFFKPAPLQDFSTARNLLSSIVKQGPSGYDKIKTDSIRSPHHIVKKPVYFRDASGASVLPLEYDLISSTAPEEPATGFIWYDTGTEKVYIRRASNEGIEYWEHVGPFEEAITATDESRAVPFKEFDVDNILAKANNVAVLNGDTLSNLDKIIATIDPPEFVSNRSFQDILTLAEEGYLKQVQVGTTLLGVPIFEYIFIKQPRIKTSKEFLNEVAAADSGTAFVPIYCLPSYFLEAYVGEDGTHASF